MLGQRQDTDAFVPYGAWVVAGSRVVTKSGLTPIEHLCVGDEVITRSSGFQKIECLGNTRQFKNKFQDVVMIRAGAMNNETDIFLSPNHKVLIHGAKVKQHFEQIEYLVAVKDLVNGDTILNLEASDLEYHSLVLRKHELIYVEAIAAESFNLIDMNAQEYKYFNDKLSEKITEKQAGFQTLTKPILSQDKAAILREHPDILLRK